MNIVLDASAGVVLAATATPQRLRDCVTQATWVGAPDLYDCEVTNAIWKYHRFGNWSEEQSTIVLTRALELVDERYPSNVLAIEALTLARQQEQPAYDMFYLILARRQDALLVTLDEKMLSLAVKIGVRTNPELLCP